MSALGCIHQTMPDGIQFEVRPYRPRILLIKCPTYTATLFDLAEVLAREVRVWCSARQDESMRIVSFKALGWVYVVDQMICDAAGISDPTEASSGEIQSDGALSSSYATQNSTLPRGLKCVTFATRSKITENV